ncbi:hypothetical protein [Burkholderia ubonensis]|uniref:hypothetical protein n=1 Tax=Burkholderia ubonensis TaxID=101571 RepID=UPI0009B31B31|nr:hypothetical protein [Burkholderia ubonensis]
MVRLTGAVALVPPSVTAVCVGSSYFTALDNPVDNDATLLFVVLRPVDSDVVDDVAVKIVVDKELSPVDSDATLLLVVLRPVDSDAILLFAVLNPDDVDVDSELIAVTAALSCEPLIASVLVSVTWPAATFVIVRTG